MSASPAPAAPPTDTRSESRVHGIKVTVVDVAGTYLGGGMTPGASLNTAVLAFESIRRGQVPIGGSTGAMLARSLDQMRELIDRSLVVVRLEAGQYQPARFALAALVEDAEVAATLFAQERAVIVTVQAVDPALILEADRLSLVSVISNLLHNAIKFTPAGGGVAVKTRVVSGRVLVSVEDACGGLPPGALAELFLSFSQRAPDRSGVGLGLSIALRAARACGGDLLVSDRPGHGCIFSLDLPLAPDAGVMLKI